MPAPRLFRVFISSTFSDFQPEREALQNIAFPRIRQACEARGAEFQPVDLRWGISEEAGRRRDTMRICLDEIARCRQLSPRPNFIVLLGDRYGWRPLPAAVPAAELALLLGCLRPEEREAVRRAYRVDDNAIPPLARLRNPEDTAMAGLDERELLASLSRAAVRAGLPDGARLRYGASATHQEIVHGALAADAADVAEHVFAYSRTIEDLPPARDEAAVAEFVDLDEHGPDVEARDRLRALRSQLRAVLGANFREYTPGWREARASDSGYLARLCADVERDLLHVIHAELSAASAADAAPEGARHRAFAADRARLVVGRERELAAIRAYALGDGGQPLVVRGAGGSGKSALLARAWLDLSGTDEASPLTIARFIGASPDSVNPRHLVDDIVGELTTRSGLARPAVEREGSGAESPADRLAAALTAASRRRRVVLFVDGIDQLAGAAALDDWLPLEFPTDAHVVLSSRPAAGVDAWIRQLRGWHPLDVPPLGAADGMAMLDGLLSAGSRRLTAPQQSAVLESFAETGLPLHLRVAADIAETWTSFDPVPSLATGVRELIRQFLGMLSRPEQHGAALVGRAAGYLAAARFGLSEQELLTALSADALVMDEFRARSRHPWPRPELPPVVWARLRADLAPWLAYHAADGSLLLRFFHGEFQEAIDAEIAEAGQKTALHAALASALSVPIEPDLFRAALSGDPRVLRATSEVPYHLTCARRPAEAAALLQDMAFAMAKCAANRGDDLGDDWDRLDRAWREIGAPAREWASFVGERRHILARGDVSWRGHQILLQLACEHDNGGAVQQSAEAWLRHGLCDWLWLHAPPRPPGGSARAPIRVVSQHAAVAVVLPIGPDEILAAGAGGFARVWNTEEWRAEPVRVGMPTADAGLRLSDGAAILWHPRDTRIVVLGPDGRSVRGVLEGSPPGGHGRTAEGVLVASPPGGHWLGVLGAVELPRQRLLTWSFGRFHIWDLGTFECVRAWGVGHWKEDPAEQSSWEADHGALALSRGRLVLWHSGVARGTAGDDAPAGSLRRSAGNDEDTQGGIESDAAGHPRVTEIWDVNEAFPRLLASWSEPISRAIALDESTFLTWSASHATVRSSETGAEIRRLVQADAASGWTPAQISGALALDQTHVLLCAGGPSRLPPEVQGDAESRIWNVTTGEVAVSLEDSDHPIEGAVSLGGGCFAAWRGGRLTLHAFTPAADRVHRVMPLAGHAAQIRGGCLLPDGELLTWSDDGTLRCWDPDFGEEAPAVAPLQHHRTVMGAMTDDANACLSWSADGAVLHWDVQTGSAVLAGTSGDRLEGALPLPQEQAVVLWTRSSIQVWSVGTGELRAEASGFVTRIGAVASLSSDAVLVWAERDSEGCLLRWPLDGSGDPEVLMAAPEPRSVSMPGLLTIGGRRVILWGGYSATLPGDLVVADLDVEEMWGLPAVESVDVTGALALRDGQHLVTWTFWRRHDAELALWNLETGLVGTLRAPEMTRAPLPVLELGDGRLLLRDRGTSMSIRRLEPWTHELILEGHTDTPEHVHVASDGLIVSWTAAGEFILWDLDADSAEVPSWRTLSALLPDYGAHLLHADRSRIAPVRLRDLPAVPIWHAGEDVAIGGVFPDGTLVAMHAGGRVSFPALHLGARRVRPEAAVEWMRQSVASRAPAQPRAPQPRIVHVRGGDESTPAQRRYCLGCGELDRRGAAECSNCGLALAARSPALGETMRVCMSCAQSCPVWASYCPHCGAALG